MASTSKIKKNCELSDFDIISDILGSQKSLVKLYTTSLCEIAEEPLRNIINEQLTECACDQFDAFNYMNDRGLYKTEQAPAQKIKEAKQKFAECECGQFCCCDEE